VPVIEVMVVFGWVIVENRGPSLIKVATTKSEIVDVMPMFVTVIVGSRPTSVAIVTFW